MRQGDPLLNKPSLIKRAISSLWEIGLTHRRVNNSGTIVRRLSLKSGARREVNMEKRTKQLMPKQNEGGCSLLLNKPSL